MDNEEAVAWLYNVYTVAYHESLQNVKAMGMMLANVSMVSVDNACMVSSQEAQFTSCG